MYVTQTVKPFISNAQVESDLQMWIRLAKKIFSEVTKIY